MRRGSITISFAPRSTASFIRAPTTGCPSVGLAPVSRRHAVRSMSSNEFVPPDSPKLRISPSEVGEWQTREQLSMLFVPIAVRNSFISV